MAAAGLSLFDLPPLPMTPPLNPLFHDCDPYAPDAYRSSDSGFDMPDPIAVFLKSHAYLQDQCRQQFSTWPYLPSVHANIQCLDQGLDNLIVFD